MSALRFAIFPLTGFAIGWLVHRAQPAARLPNAPRETTTPSAEAAPAARTGTPSELPLAALGDALASTSELRRLAEFARLIDGFNAAQFAALHAELIARRPPIDPRLLAHFFRRWALVAPQAAVDAALADRAHGVNGIDSMDGGLKQALYAWCERDPTAARARAASIVFSGDFDRRVTLDNLLALSLPKPGQFPPGEGLRRIHEQTGGKMQVASFNAIGAIVRDWAKADPQAAWLGVLAMPAMGQDKEGREWAMSQVIATHTADDPAGVAQWIAALPTDERNKLGAGYVSSLAMSGKTQLARDYALALSAGPARAAALGDLAGSWMQRDPEAAKAFVLGLPAADWHEPGRFNDFFRRWFGDEPERAAEALLAHLPPDAQFTERERDDFEINLGRVPGSDKERCEFLLRLPPEIRDHALERGVTGFTFRDAPGAAEWAGALPEGELRDRTFGKIAEVWSRRDLTASTQWLDTLPASSAKSSAVESFARQIVSTSPDDALAWLRAVPDEADRLARMQRVWKTWADRTAAQQWVDNAADLTPAERAALRP